MTQAYPTKHDPADQVTTLQNDQVNTQDPVCLYDSPDHKIYWIGSEEETNFHCNAYLIRTTGGNFLVDPGSRLHFPQVRRRVNRIMDTNQVTHIIAHHQDPDLCASIPLWLEENPQIQVLTNSRAAVLLPHYGFKKERITCTDDTCVTLPTGGELRFISSPWMHFPGAFVTYDTTSKFLFSSDIFCALSGDWELFVDDIETHKGFMELFHIDYMACNKACRNFVKNLEGLEINAVLPQHGSVIRGQDVWTAFDWLKELECGLDLLYPDTDA